VQLMGRSGGWPLTVFLTPSQKPFFAGTYFPPDDRHGMPGFPKILKAIAEAYRDRREDVDGQADDLTKAIASIGKGDDEDGSDDSKYTPSPDLLERTTQMLLKRFDTTHGGFGRAPKFPNTMPLEVVMRRGVLEKDGTALDAARLQLDSMRNGGIWDHLGGGFHRYSTDERWLVPHFEKMLYDNALLLRSYVDGYRAFQNHAGYAATARAIVRYVDREMTDAEGGYYASQDADSEGEEGKFFVWDEAEVKAAVKAEADAAIAVEYFGITMAGNFEDHGRPTFKTVLSETRALRDPAAREALERATNAMFEVREKRPKPFRDEKILTSWSSMMIGAMAEAGAVLGDEKMIASAERALAFIESKLFVANGRVARLTKKVGDGKWIVKEPGFLDDHSYLINAALDLYEATGNPNHVELARKVTKGMLDAFYDDSEGFYFTPKDGESLITRSKDPYDNAVPSGMSIACRALLRLGTLVDASLTKIAEKELVRLAPACLRNPFGYGQSICEMDRLVRGSVDVVLVGKRDDDRTKSLAKTVFSKWLPNRTIAWADPTDPKSIDACALLAEGKPSPKKGEPVAYVCRGRTCSLPVSTSEELRKLL
jgi:uncharacterized protein